MTYRLNLGTEMSVLQFSLTLLARRIFAAVLNLIGPTNYINDFFFFLLIIV